MSPLLLGKNYKQRVKYYVRQKLKYKNTSDHGTLNQNREMIKQRLYKPFKDVTVC